VVKTKNRVPAGSIRRRFDCSSKWSPVMHENFVWNGLFALTTGTGISFEPRELDKQMIVVLSTPHRSRWGNSSRAVNSYAPLGGESGSASESRGCATIGKRTMAKSAQDSILPFIGVPSALAKACIDTAW
jgi:hypothetical protein